ncbi:MAG: pilus assembly protein PilM [Armatimonadetes bacterium]|nr:pilus assembly protein PilM [Armatimonadota bacterium]MDE2206335.1 pilus assembly protein PilM [Armatimonadota bacterium]
MRVPKKPILGIHVHPLGVRAIEARGAWSSPQFANAREVPLPAGAIDAGRIMQPDALVAALRELVGPVDGPTDVVMSISARGVMTHVIEAPPAPDAEMRTVIEGELEHYHIVTTANNAIDYLRLQQRDGNRTDPSPQVLVSAAEQSLVDGYCDAAERAGLRLVGLEPELLAMYRLAAQEAGQIEAAIAVTVGSEQTELAVTSQGAIRLYRRIDVGARQLVGAQPGLSADPLTGPVVQTGPGFNVVSAMNLATELRRSLDYYGSQFPEAVKPENVVLVVQDAELAGLADWLGNTLRLPVTLASPQILSDGAAPGESNCRYAAAAGLAMHNLASHPNTVPRFDLAKRNRAADAVEFERRKLVGALAISIAAVAAGVIIAVAVGIHANVVQAAVSQQKQSIAGLQQQRGAEVARAQHEDSLSKALAGQGYPLPWVMDAVAQSMAEKAGLSDARLDPGAKLVLTGDAATNQAVIQTLEHLRDSTQLQGASLDSFDSTNEQHQKQVVHFQISAYLAGAPAATVGGVKQGG